MAQGNAKEKIEETWFIPLDKYTILVYCSAFRLFRNMYAMIKIAFICFNFPAASLSIS